MGENIFTKSFPVLVLIGTFIAQHALGQITDDFSDGNFTDAPAWSGSVGSFIVNGSQQLQLNALAAGSSSLTVPFSIPPGHNTEWQFFISHTFASSASNNSRIYLISNSENLTGPLNGYYLQFGENLALDAVELFKQSGNTSTSIIRGPDGDIAAANFTVRVKVTRSSNGEWQLFIDKLGGTNFSATSTATENTFTTGSFFGIRCLYSITNINRFFYDDFSVTTAQAPDVSAPQLDSVRIVSPEQIELNFSEKLMTDVLTPADFILNDTLSAISATYVKNDSAILLTFSHPMINGFAQKIQYPIMYDLASNESEAGESNFLFFQAVPWHANDIVITEIYPDPSPSIGLPLYEFIEIYNQSEHPFQLENWVITDGTTHGILKNRILLPKEYLVLVPNEATSSYQPFGNTMGLQHFPSLNNSGDSLTLTSLNGTVIDLLEYTLTAYQDEDKNAGGYTLERIDPTNFCLGIENWKASDAELGGTPGMQNAAHMIEPDVTGPKLIDVVPKTETSITLEFDERLSGTLPPLESFIFPFPNEKLSVDYSDEGKTKIDLHFSSALDSTVLYSITATNIFDCPGNALQHEFSSGSFKLDMIEPEIVAITVLSLTQFQILFSEKIKPSTITPASLILEGFSAEVLPGMSENDKLLTVDLGGQLINGKDYLLTILGLEDYSGNLIDTVTQVIRFFEASAVSKNDVVINEFFADPSPVIGLPEGEFIEIFNRSSNAIDLSGWTVTDGSAASTLPFKIILPGQRIILCQNVFASAYSLFGETIGFNSFPSLNNSGDLIKLLNSQNETIDSVQYQSSWYHDDDKKDGGWSIERINPNDFCSESANWKASTHERGGTPGQVNSVFALTEDLVPPEITDVAILSTDSILVSFNERLSQDVAQAGNIAFSPAIPFDIVAFTDPFLRTVAIKLGQPMDSLLTYQVVFNQVEDCPGNEMLSNKTAFFRLDNTRPQVKSVITKNDVRINVTFSERIKTDEAIKSRFYLEGRYPENVVMADAFSVELIFDEKFVNGKKYQLLTSGVQDLSGNVSDSSEHLVMHFLPHPTAVKDIIITEIFADPTPTQGLPETEFIEIFNRSDFPVQLQNWTLSDESHQVEIKPYILLAGEYLVLTNATKAFQFQSALGISSFPTLTNAGEPLALRDSLGLTIDSVFYSDEWYNDSESKDGGWSLELIDPDNVCAENENWTSSEEPSGGTPGKVNSVIAEKPDLTSPEVISVVAVSSDTVEVSFNEKLNEELPPAESFLISPAIIVNAVRFADQSKRALRLYLLGLLGNRVKYSISITNIFDCAGNAMSAREPIFFALPETPAPGDIVVNEILFNPRPTGVDFVELFNRSEKYINLKGWATANFVNDTVENKKSISETNLVFSPGDYLVLTPDPNILKGEYLQSLEEKILKASTPSLPDDEGSLIIVDEKNQVIDTLIYADDQHSPFLKNTEGVSLERIDINSPSSNKRNWQSASATIGYATPGFLNGSALQNIFEEAVFVEPEIFSPSSGQPDFAMISYNFDHAGYVANVKIVNQQGRVIKTVAENELLGAEGFFTWRGDTAQGLKATVGAYMVWFEAFDDRGKVVTMKKRVVIAEKF